MKKVINFAKGYGLALASLAVPALASAQATVGFSGPQSNIGSLQDILNYLCIIFGWMFWFLVVAAVIFVLVAAFRYLSAGGNPEAVSSAGRTLLYAGVAIGVALLARAIPLIVGSFLGAGTVTSC